MDDIMQKLQEVLSDEESMKQIEELAQMFSSQIVSEEQSEKSQSEQSGAMPDISAALPMLLNFMNSPQNDKNSALLIALKPHLSEERQQRLDKAIKLMHLVEVVKSAKASGILDNLI